MFKMVQEMDKAPKTPPVGPTGTSSAFIGPLTPSELIGTPEVPTQGASFRILERYLSEEEKGGAGKNLHTLYQPHSTNSSTNLSVFPYPQHLYGCNGLYCVTILMMRVRSVL